MCSYVVLLRGVNVGKAKRVPMADLKALLLRLGCSDVTTVLNSGNAVVTLRSSSADTLAQDVGAAIRSTFGFDVPVVVKSARALRTIVLGNRLISSSTNPSRMLVAFAQTSRALRALEPITRTVRGALEAVAWAKAGIASAVKTSTTRPMAH